MSLIQRGSKHGQLCQEESEMIRGAAEVEQTLEVGMVWTCEEEGYWTDHVRDGHDGQTKKRRLRIKSEMN